MLESVVFSLGLFTAFCTHLVHADTSGEPKCTFPGMAGSIPVSACRECHFLRRLATDPVMQQKKQASWNTDPGTGGDRAVGVFAPYGYGKTLLVNKIAQSAEVPLRCIEIGPLSSPEQRNDAIKRMRTAVQEATTEAQTKNQVVALFFDETASSGAAQYTPQELYFLSTFLSSLISDKSRDVRVRIYYAVSGTSIEHKGLLSRSEIIRIDAPDEESRRELFEAFFAKQGINLPTDVAAYYAKWSGVISPREIHTFALQISKDPQHTSWTSDTYKAQIFMYRAECLHRPYRNPAQRVWDGATYSNVTALIGLVATIAGIGKGALTIAGWWKKDAPPKIDTPVEKDDLSKFPAAPEAGG